MAYADDTYAYISHGITEAPRVERVPVLIEVDYCDREPDQWVRDAIRRRLAADGWTGVRMWTQPRPAHITLGQRLRVQWWGYR